MTHILIIQGHPDPAPGHLCHAIADAYQAAGDRAGYDIERIDIGQSDVPFLRSRQDWESDNIPEIAASGQDAVSRADHIVLIYPLWMGDVPALLKAWIEQVMRSGFAFEMSGKAWRPALKGRSARVIVTMGMPGFAYRWFFFAHSLRSLDRNILKFCGIRPVKWTIIGNAEDPKGKVQQRALATATRLGAQAG